MVSSCFLAYCSGLATSITPIAKFRIADLQPKTAEFGETLLDQSSPQKTATVSRRVSMVFNHRSEITSFMIANQITLLNLRASESKAPETDGVLFGHTSTTLGFQHGFKIQYRPTSIHHRDFQIKSVRNQLRTLNISMPRSDCRKELRPQISCWVNIALGF